MGGYWIRKLILAIALFTGTLAWLPANAGSLLSDVGITLESHPDTVYTGEAISYTARVTNNGPLTAEAVRVSFSLPGNAVLGRWFVNQGSCDAGARSLDCQLGDIPLNQTVLLTVEGTPTQAGDNIAFTEILASGNNDLITSNDHATAHTNVLPAVDMVAEIQQWSPAYVDGTTAYGIYAHDYSTVGATGITVDLSITPASEIVAARPMDENDPPCEISGQDIHCSSPAVESGSYRGFQLTLVPKDAGSVAGVCETVAAAEHDPDTSNNRVCQGAIITKSTDLLVDGVSATPNPVRVGRSLTYTARVRNLGPSPATGVVVTNDLPAQVSFVSASTQQGSCTASGATVRCDLGAMASGDVLEISILVRVRDVGSFVDYWHVTGDARDPNLYNNDEGIRVDAQRKV
jgi:uncharacterized repeat protein (TIGR01451 family)